MIAVTLLALSFALQTQPPRDARRSASGTASIRGRVMSDESRPRPLRRARVTLSRGPVDLAENAITEDDGSFTFSSVPAGRYTLAVAKEGYVPMMYGARRPARPGTPIVLHEREVKELTVRLPPGAVVTGLITDAAGQPVQGAAVSAFASMFDGATGERRLAPAGQTTAASTGSTDSRRANISSRCSRLSPARTRCRPPRRSSASRTRAAGRSHRCRSIFHPPLTADAHSRSPSASAKSATASTSAARTCRWPASAA
jgi:carboxypeptidase family protein